MNPIWKFGSIVVLACGAFIASPSSAQSLCPGSTVRFLVPFPGSGSTTDIMARALTTRLALMWSKNVIVDNKPGAGGIIATQIVATSAPDGCTIGVVTSAIAVNPRLMKKLPYDTLNDLTMVGVLIDFPIGIFALPTFPANTVAELIAYAKAQPQGLTFGTSGVGAGAHLAGALLATMTGANLIHVPYKSTPNAEIDLLTGRISLMFAVISSEVGVLKAGKLKLIAVVGDKRFSPFPDVPTVGETIPGYSMHGYMGVVAPAGMPRQAVAQLSQDIARALTSPEVVARANSMYMITVGSTPEELEKLVREDMQSLAKLIKAIGIEPQ